MSETDHRTEPHVSTEELRAALAPRGETRRNPVLVTEQAEHAEGEIAQLRDALEAARADETELRTELDLSRRAIDSARADAIELRAALDAARGDAAELRAELATAKAEPARAAQRARALANAGCFKRRKLIAELHGARPAVAAAPRAIRAPAPSCAVTAPAGGATSVAAAPASRRPRTGRCRSSPDADAR